MLVNDKSSRTKEPSVRQCRQTGTPAAVRKVTELAFSVTSAGTLSAPPNDFCSATTIWRESHASLSGARSGLGQHASACNMTRYESDELHRGRTTSRSRLDWASAGFRCRTALSLTNGRRDATRCY